MSGEALAVVGDVLLDRDLDGRVERLSPDAPVPVVQDPVERSRPGGAGLAAVLAAADGRQVFLVTGLSRDQAGSQLRGLLASAGVHVIDLGSDGPTSQKVRVLSAGRSLMRLDHGGPGPYRPGPVTNDAVAALSSVRAVLISDYGRGLAAEPAIRDLLGSLGARVPMVWDPHPRGPQPVPGVRLATPNGAEAASFAPGIPGEALSAVTARAKHLASLWSAASVAVTLGPRGALLVSGDGPPLVVPAPAAASGEACGAGDRFSSTAAASLADGALPSEAVAAAVASASSFVAAGGAGALALGPHEGASFHAGQAGTEAADVIHQVRTKGGTVVATGGCFDLLHAGHVSTLEAARALGDCLVVCLNSDSSVRRLKGADRPLVPERDRAAVLMGLECVDAVVIFDEDTPEAALSRLRPDIFAKGGDYAMADLPEERALSSWGGQVVILPYLEGRSTTGLIERVGRSGA